MDFKNILEKLMQKDLKPIIFYVVFFLFILAYNLTAQAYDYDLWARLIVGKCFMQTGQVLKHDFLSYTPTHTWYDHEWGSGVVFYITQHYFTHVGLLMLQVILLFLIYFTITKIVKLRGVQTTHPYNFIFYFFSLCAITQVVDQPIRCQLFSFFFFTIFLYILELARKGENRPLWLMPVIMLVWNNLHGGCVAGLGLIAMYIIGEFINRKPVKKYLAPFILSLLVLPINPWGFKYLVFLVHATTMKRPDIMEWFDLFTPMYNKAFLEFRLFAATMIFAEVGYIVKAVRSKVFNFDATKFIVILSTLYLATSHVKHIPFAVISMTAFLYDDIYTIFNLVTFNIFNKVAKYKDFLVYGLAFVFIFININKQNFDPFLEWNKYPIRVVEFMRLNDIKGNLFVNFGQGSFVSYKLYPHNKIYMDGRYEEVYYDYMLPIMQEFFLAGPKWDTLFKTFPPEVLLIEKNYPIYKKLATVPEWKRIFADNNFALFVKANKVKKEYKQPSVFLDYYKKTLFDSDINFVLQSEHEQK